MRKGERLTQQEIEEIRRIVRERMAKVEFVLEEGPNGECFVVLKGDPDE